MMPDPDVMARLAMDETIAALQSRRRYLSILIDMVEAEKALRGVSIPGGTIAAPPFAASSHAHADALKGE